MKKYLVMLFGIMSFLGINTVSADTLVVTHNQDFEKHVSNYITYKDMINDMVDYWEENFSQSYPYYAIFSLPNGSGTGPLPIFMLYYGTDNIINLSKSGLSTYVYEFDSAIQNDDNSYAMIKYDVNTNSYTYSDFVIPSADFSNSSKALLLANNLIYKDTNETGYTTIKFSSYVSNELNLSIPEFEINEGDIFPTILSLYDGSYDDVLGNYVEINLNDYSYIALSLKDYNKIPENNYSTYTNIYVKGQLCSTPVYNYGQTERKEILSGTQVQGCTSYYDDFTLLRKYILKTDVENHAIYYLKGYDSTKENIVKIDTSVYNISYITEENKDNPQVNINGKIYPTLSYDSLTDTATKSEDEGYISGVVCPVGDLNCYNENNPGNVVEDLFDKPLEALKNVWTAITSIFSVITEFILLLPPTMQGFLYVSFGIAIILGIIKILL